MTNLSKRDTELVALGAAVGSNCVPCVVFHVQEARNCGLTDEEIREAVDSADKLKRMPATLVLNAAHQELCENPTEPSEEDPAQSGCGCQSC
jgi:4-carboxymuconolactone decarboxylase